MKTPSCEDFELLIPDALTGRLAPDDAAALEAHLAACAACRSAYEDCSRASAALEGSFPSGGTQAAHVWARVAQSVQVQAPAPVRLRAPRRALWAGSGAEPPGRAKKPPVQWGRWRADGRPGRSADCPG